MALRLGIITISLSALVLVGCEYEPTEEEVLYQTVQDYNYKQKAIDENYQVSKKKAKIFSSVIKEGVLNNSQNYIKYLKKDSYMYALQDAIKTIRLKDKEILERKKFNTLENEMYADLDTYHPDTTLQNYSLTRDYKDYIKEYYFKDSETGSLHQTYIVTLPLEGYVGKFEIHWSGGEIIDVQEYISNS